MCLLYPSLSVLLTLFCQVLAEEEQTLVFTIPIFEPLPSQYYVRGVSDRWLGSEVVCALSFKHLILPEKHPPHTELLDLQPLPITALKCKDYELLYRWVWMLSLTIYRAIGRCCHCCCRYEDDSCLRCEIVFDYRSHCFIRRVGLWPTAVATLEVWVCGPVLSLRLDHWKREIYVVIYYKKEKGFFARSSVMKVHESWVGCALKWTYFI